MAEDEEVDDKGLDIFDRLASMKQDAELIEAANLFVTQLLHLAQDEALKRGPSNKVTSSVMTLIVLFYRPVGGA
jgi:hypothetical protein